jgi:hypothetical protein
VIDGGQGNDTLDLSALTSDATVYLVANGIGSATSADSGTDTLRNIENVRGGAGNDVIVASSDANVLEGGIGIDTFVFNSASAANGDTIVDFHTGDLINLKPLFAALNLTEDTASHFNNATTFTVAGEFRLRVEGEDTLIEGTTDSDGDVDFSIRVTDRTDLKVTDFA